MTKYAKIMATFGVLAGLGVASLPLATFATNNSETTVKVPFKKVSLSLTITLPLMLVTKPQVKLVLPLLTLPLLLTMLLVLRLPLKTKMKTPLSALLVSPVLSLV